MSGNDSHVFLTWLYERHYRLLVTFTLVYICVAPFGQAAPWVFWLLEVLVLVLMFLALLSVWGTRRMFIAGVVLLVAQQLLRVAGTLTDQTSAVTTSDGVKLALLLAVLLSIARDIVKSTRVTLNTVFGACSVYLLLALSWQTAYVMLEDQFPGSFQLAVNEPSSWTDRFGPMVESSKLLYFSLITLTTVGYGDITPLSAPARSLASVEGVVGQLFIAVIIARFVALEVAHRTSTGGSS